MVKGKWKIYLLTVVLWLLVCLSISLWHGYYSVHNSEDQDFYAHNWGFSGLVMLVFEFPLWISILAVVLSVEIFVLERRGGNKGVAKGKGD